MVGRDSVVGIATRCGLDGPGSNPGGGRWAVDGDFPHPSTLALEPTQPPIKRPGRGVDLPPPSSAEVKERAEI